MSKVRGCKEGFPHDPSINMPTEQKASESNKQKIAKIHDMFPNASKDHIAKILQFCDDDESRAIDAITRDGGREALSCLADSSSSKNKNNKNKKKKKRSKKDLGGGMTATASFDADDSSSLHSGGNAEVDVEKDCPRTENGNGLFSDTGDDLAPQDRMLGDRLGCGELEQEALESEKENKPEPPKERSSPPPPEAPSVTLDCDRMPAAPLPCAPLLPDSFDRPEEPVARKEKYRSSNESSSKPSPRQRTSSFRRSKSSSISEDSSSQHNPQATAAPTKRGYDKCKKDLNRQTISLQRIHALVERGFEDASKKIKTQHSELQKLLEKRLKEIESELEERKQEAFNLCKSRQDLAVELKKRLDRTPSLSETEWTELRSDVKQFVTERKYDDELGKTIWFQWEDISQVISNFGEVPPVKNVYSQRSHSALGHSGASNNPEPSPSSSLANEENESFADKNDVGNISDTAEDETPIPEKEEVAPTFTKPHPIENRTRVYSNKQFERSNRGRFNSNRGSGYYRGNRGGGGGYNRPNYRGNYQYNRHNNYNSNYEHSYGERDGRSGDGPSYPADRNLNNNRDNKLNRNQGRGHVNYKYNNNNRYARGGHRYNPEHPGDTEPSTNASAANTEKTNIVNGYVNSNN